MDFTIPEMTPKFWSLYLCPHCSLCIESIPTSISNKNLSLLPDHWNANDRIFLDLLIFLGSPLPLYPRLLCLLSGLRTILKAEDLSRWSESPLKFHAQFEGMCIRVFSEERVHGFHQRLKEYMIHPSSQKG